MIIAVLALGCCTFAVAQIAMFADVKARNGVQLSADDLKQLMPDAKVVSRTQAGSTRSWQNKPDRTFMASSDGRGTSGGRNDYAAGAGTWRVADDGRLCVKIAWPRNPDDWCRFMFKVGDKYYGVGKLEDTGPAMEFEFSK